MTNQAQKNIKYTLSTLAIERLSPSDEALQLCEKNSNGQISTNDAVIAILKKYNIEVDVQHV